VVPRSIFLEDQSTAFQSLNTRDVRGRAERVDPSVGILTGLKTRHYHGARYDPGSGSR
jgi:hypothetical protein